MENIIQFPTLLDLQLFAEGGASGASSGTDGGGDAGAEGATGVSATAAVSQRKGVKSNPLAGVKYGVQPEEATPAAEVNTTAPEEVEDRNAKFEALIKGEYKDLYDARVQDTVQKRVKSSKESEKEAIDKYNALSPILEILSKKHGVDATDTKALLKAIEEDDSYFEEEALEKGVSVEQLKEIRKMERENATLKKQMEEQNRRENAAHQYAIWMDQAKEAKNLYPALDLDVETKNLDFLKLLHAGIDVGNAYFVIHKDEILPAAMQYTAKQAEQKLVNNMIANGSRPTENGNSSQGASITKSDVSQLTKEDRAEINRRVGRGERITFTR